LFQEGKRGGLPHWSGWNGVTVAALAISVLIGSENAYYAFFACFFVLVAGLASYVSRRRFYPLCNAGILNAVVILTLLVSTAPHFIYKRHQGADPDAVVRSPEHGEIYGLKIIQLLLPAEYHRVGRLRHYTDTYDRVSPLVNENVSASLGVVASVGFLFLIGRLLWLGRREGELSPLDVLCLLNIFAILLATIGGFGTVFSWGISPWIRSYNRISIYIGFFAIFMVVACLEALRRRYARSTASRVCFYAILGLLATAGILDQTPSYVSATDAFAQREYSSDAEFIGRIEAALPPDAMIYQMPHVTFPDSGHVLEYGHLRAYLHSTRLHWSHGAMKGRPEGTWQDEMASKPLQEMIPSLAHAGFGGIYVDRRGFADAGASVQAELTRIVGMPPQVSNDAKLLFFNLTAYVKNLKGRYTEKEWEAERQMTLYPQQLRYLWQNGFYFEEKDLQKRWRWCSSEGKLVIENPASRSRQVTLKMGFATAYPESTPLRIDSDLLSTPRLFKPGEDVILEKLTIMPGKHVLHFACDARRLECADARRLVFNVTNFTALGAD
jgi:phosphoglycerol transferase